MRIAFFLCALLIPFFSCTRPSQLGETPTEDLMREHGVLERLLLIYEEIGHRIDTHGIDTHGSLEKESLKQAATLVRTFIEDYHERLEEEFLFPRFESSYELGTLVATLKAQHEIGRSLTDSILKAVQEENLSESQMKDVSNIMKEYSQLFRPHVAREDTVVFPAFKKKISPEEFTKLGDLFEDREHDLFGENGFFDIVKKIEAIEKELHIYQLKA